MHRDIPGIKHELENLPSQSILMVERRALLWTGHRREEQIHPRCASLQGTFTQRYISQLPRSLDLIPYHSRSYHTHPVLRTSSGVLQNLQCLHHVLQIAVSRYGMCERGVVKVPPVLTLLTRAT